MAMKLGLLILGLLLALSAPANAAPPAPVPPPATPVPMSAVDLQIALIAIQNAGQACDLGVKVYCQLVGVRDGTTAKLLSGVKALQGDH
jgi:hypothetical protein